MQGAAREKGDLIHTVTPKHRAGEKGVKGGSKTVRLETARVPINGSRRQRMRVMVTRRLMFDNDMD